MGICFHFWHRHFRVWMKGKFQRPNQTKPKHCISIIKPIRRIAWDLGLFMMGFSDLIYWFICLLHCRRVPRTRPLHRKHRSSQWLLSGRPHRIFCRVWNWNSCLLFNKLIFHSAILFSVTFFSCFCFYFRGLKFEQTHWNGVLLSFSFKLKLGLCVCRCFCVFYSFFFSFGRFIVSLFLLHSVDTAVCLHIRYPPVLFTHDISHFIHDVLYSDVVQRKNA